MLRTEGLSAGYGAFTVLHGLSLHVGPGETVALVGPNGAGKTTLVRALCGLIPVQGGRISKDGADITNGAAHRRLRCGIASLLENRRLFGEFSVRDNLRLADEAGRRHRSAQAQFSLTDIGELFPMILERQDARASVLSGGQQQQVAIARALLLQPDLLILDEPSTGLAPKVMQDILQVLQTLRRRGLAILLVEQSVRIAIEMTERAYVMSLGRILHEVAGDEWRAFAQDERLAAAYLGTTTPTAKH